MIKRLFWKAIIRILKCKKMEYKKALQIGTEIYIVDIYKFIPIDKELQKWKDALEKSRTQNYK